VIPVAVQSTNGDLFLRSFELSVDLTVIGAAMRLDAKSAVRPELPLAAETVRGLQNARQYGRSDRIDRRNLAESRPGLVFLAFREQPACPTRNDLRRVTGQLQSSKYPINVLIGSQPSEGRDLAGARALGKFVVSRRGEAYDAHEQEALIGNPGLGP
jgi:hypothetical protein